MVAIYPPYLSIGGMYVEMGFVNNRKSDKPFFIDFYRFLVQPSVFLPDN